MNKLFLELFLVSCLHGQVDVACEPPPGSVGDKQNQELVLYHWETVYKPYEIDQTQLSLYCGDKQLGNWRFTDKTYWRREADGWFYKDKCPIGEPAKPTNEKANAIDEVNARRASKGLRPYTSDPTLAKAALECARYRATHLIRGHTDDFSFVPAGYPHGPAGCACWEPGTGWGSCCSDENWTYAGAAWAMGRDGMRYMSLFVR